MKISKRFALISLLILSFLAVREKAMADDYLWQAGNGLWDDDSNWDPFGHPNAAGDSATFNAAGPPTFNVSLNSGTFTVGRMFMNGDSADGYTFSSGTLQLDGTATIQVDTHNTNPDFASSLTLNLLANSTINTTLANTTFQIDGQVTGGFSLTKTGPGTLILTGNNTYSGGTNLNEGQITVGSNTALGTGAVTAADGTVLSSFGFSDIRILANNFNVQGNFGLEPNFFNTIRLDGTIDLQGGTRTLTILTPATAGVSFTGVIQNGTGLTLLTSGTSETFGMSGSGSNTYSGTTTVGDGNNHVTLLLNKSGMAVAIPGALVANNAEIDLVSTNPNLIAGTAISLEQSFLFDSANNTLAANKTITLIGGLNFISATTGHTFTVDSKITGTGGFSVENGTLVLTNNTSDYSGGTTLYNGTLFVDAHNALGTGPLTISNGNGTLGSHTFNIEIDNAITVNDDFSINPAGGLMSLRGPIDLGGGSRTITNINNANVAFTNTISNGTGLTLTSSTSGLFQFTGSTANTYTGTTTVSGNADLLLSKTVATNIAIPGNLVISNTAQVSELFDQQIADAATVTVNDSADFELRTGIHETIAALNGASATATTSLGSGSVLTVDSGVNGSFDGVIQGDGAVVKNGAGAQILSGTNTYTGGTTLNNGTLAIGNLNGLGTGNMLVNGGTLQTFNGPRPISVGGNYTQNLGGTLQLQIGGTDSGAESDFVSVSGTASLAGTLNLVRVNNYNPANGDRVNIIGGTHNGMFDTVNDTFTGLLHPSVHYDDPLDVYLLFQLSSFNVGGLTPNQKSVARNLDVVLNDPAAANLINFLVLEPLGNLPHDYDLIAPEELASIYEIGFSQAMVQNNNLQRRMDDIRAGSNGFCANGFTPQVSGKDYTKEADGKASLPDKTTRDVYTPSPDNRWGVFVTGTGDFVNVGNDDSNARGYDITSGDFTVGADYRLCDHFAIGIDAGYSRSTADLVDDGQVDVDGGKFGAYATWFGKGFFGSKFYVDGVVGGGVNDYDTRRTGLQNDLVRGDTDGTEFNAMISYGSDWTFGCFNVGTWSSVQFTNVSIDQFTETGSLAPLEIQDQDENSFRATTGVHASYDIKAGHMIFRPEIRAAYQHEYCDQAYQIDSRLASGAGDVFRVRGPRIGRDAALVGAGMSMQWNNRLSTYVYYDGVLGRNNYDNNAVSGGLRIGF